MKATTIWVSATISGLLLAACVAPKGRTAAATPQPATGSEGSSAASGNAPKRPLTPANAYLMNNGGTATKQLKAVDRSAYSSLDVSIVGQVVQPGRYRLDSEDGCTLEELVRSAGGFAIYASLRRVQVVRPTPSSRTVITVDLTSEGLAKGNGKMKIKPGDIVFVPEFV